MDKTTAVQNYILHHVSDNTKEWHLPFGQHIPLSETFSLHAVMLVLCSVLCIITFCAIYDKKKTVPTGITNLLEVFIIFVRDEIAVPNLGSTDGRRYTPFFCTIFFFILGLNILGLIPLFSTATANINVAAGLALIVLAVMLFGAIIKNGPVGFMQAFIPPGVPIPVLFLITPLELLGTLVKAFALTIRLFANMIAGHIVLFSLIGIIIIIGSIAILPAIIMALAIYMLEIFVAFLQAFIFTLLSALFIGMVHHPSH